MQVHGYQHRGMNAMRAYSPEMRAHSAGMRVHSPGMRAHSPGVRASYPTCRLAMHTVYHFSLETLYERAHSLS